MLSTARARSLAAEQLAFVMPQRWRHLEGVARRAENIGALVGADSDVLTAAAWLHDIGYAPAAVDTGFHPLDGARWLRDAGVGDRLTALVAHHSCSLLEADERGLTPVLVAEFPREESVTADALWYCDMTTGPNGEPLEVEERIAEIRARYGRDDVVTRFITRAQPEILAAVGRTEARLRQAVDQPI